MGARQIGMRTLRMMLASLVGALSIVIWAGGPAHACSCAGGRVGDFVVRADLVLVGTMEQRDEPSGVFSSADPATYTITVDRVYKGEAGPTQTVLTPVSGASCGLENIELGQRYVVFASHRTLDGEPTGELWANLCGGTDVAVPAYVAAVEGITGAGVEPSDPAVTKHSAPLKLTSQSVGTVGSELAWPAAVTGAVVLALLTGCLWLRLLRR